MSDDQLYAVESVSLSSDGLQATITLANTNAAGATVTGLEPNVDYNMIVTNDDETASKVFYIPAVYPDATVTACDANAGTITVGYPDDDDGASWAIVGETELTVPEDFEDDYFNLLGRTVTVKFDKDMNLTYLNVDNHEKVIYGAFKGKDDKDYLTDVVTKKTYKVQEKTSGTIRPSSIIAKDNTGWAAIADLSGTDIDADTVGYSFAKLVLNSNNTIKVLVSNDEVLNPMLITYVKDNVILSGKDEQNIKDYTILKDGETITIDDIEEGDVVFYNTTNKLAVVYNNSETDELEAIYHNKFQVNGTLYDVAHDDDANMLDSTVNYIKSGGGVTAVNDDYLNALSDGGEEVTIYFGLNGQPAFLTGELGEAKTTDVKMVLTAQPKFYSEKLTDYIRLKGYTEAGSTTYDVNIGNLDKLVIEDGTSYQKGYAPWIETAKRLAANDDYKGFKVGSISIDNATTGDGSLTQDSDPAPANDLLAANAAATTFTAHTNDLLNSAFVTVTLDEDGEVIGLNFEDAAAGVGEAMTGTDNFTSKLKVVNGYQAKASTPVYIYDTAKDAVKETTLGDFSGFVGNAIAKGTGAADAGVHVYSYNEKDVTAIVVTAALTPDASGQTVQEVVVTGSKRTTDSTTKLTELTVIYQGDEATYTAFDSAVETVEPVDGSIYTMTINKDGETIDGLVPVGDQLTTDINTVKQSDQSFSLGANTGKKLASTVTPTIVVKDGGSWRAGSFSDLQDAVAAGTDPGKLVNWSYLEGSTNYVDTIVITGTANTNDNAIAADAAALKAALESVSLTVTNSTFAFPADYDIATTGPAGTTISAPTQRTTVTGFTLTAGDGTAKVVVDNTNAGASYNIDYTITSGTRKATVTLTLTGNAGAATMSVAGVTIGATTDAT